jgi:enterochelin esterase-like enzyme
MSQPRRVSRRAVLLGGAAVVTGAAGAGFAGVETGVLPGRSWLRQRLGQDDQDGTIPNVPRGLVVSDSFVSQHRGGRDCGWTIAYPTRVAEPLPVMVVLHARGGNHTSAFGHNLGLDRFLVAGHHRFAIASVDGGGDSYWHRRTSGEDSGAMVVKEFLPLLAARGLDTRLVALFGWSMGGFGALWLGGVLGQERVAAVVAESPAIWHRSEQTAPGAFDDPDDFAAHDVFTRSDDLRGIAIRIDCGTEDGFYPAARDYAQTLNPKPAGGFQTGGHTLDYWRQMAPQQLTFVAKALSR